jgi:hypothetical protein
VDETQDSKRRHFSPHEKVAVVKRHLLERVPISNQPSLSRLGSSSKVAIWVAIWVAIRRRLQRFAL